LSDQPKRCSLADGLEALSAPSSHAGTAPTVTGQPANPNPWTLLPTPTFLGLLAAKQTEPTPHCMTALAWLPPEDRNALAIHDKEPPLAAALQKANTGLIAPLETEPMQLSDSLGRSWWVLPGGPWAPLELLLQTWPTPPESVLADWKNQSADWESLAGRFRSTEPNRLKDEGVPNRDNRNPVEDPKRWWVDRQGALLPITDVWDLLFQAAKSQQETSQSTGRKKESRNTPSAFQSKPRSKTKGSGLSRPTSRSPSGNRKRTALVWVGAIALGLLGLLVPRLFQSDSTPTIPQRTEANGELTERPGVTEIQTLPPTPSDPAQAGAQNPLEPLDLRGLSPAAETAQPQPGLELSSPNLFPEGDLKAKLDRLLGGSPGELLANTPTTDIPPEDSASESDSPEKMLQSDSSDQSSPDADSSGVAPGPDRQSPVALEDRSFPLENLPLKSKWILRDQGLDPSLLLVLELERQEGWEWNRMPIPLETGKVVRAWGRHSDHPEAGGMVIQASLRAGRVWHIEVDVGWSPDPDTPPVRLSIGQADQWLGEVQSGLRWHEQALQQLRQSRNLSSNSSQRSLMLDQIRVLEAQQRSLKELELRWQKVGSLSQVFYDQQMMHLRWQSPSTDAASTKAIPDPP